LFDRFRMSHPLKESRLLFGVSGIGRRDGRPCATRAGLTDNFGFSIRGVHRPWAGMPRFFAPKMG
jgi:hypothetical protein